MVHAPLFGGLFHERLRASSKRLFWVGLAMVLLGAAAIVFPMISTMVATLLVGWVLLLAGIFQVTGSFWNSRDRAILRRASFGLLCIAAGIFLLFSPLAGAVALTLLAGGIFIVQGAVEISFAFEMRPHDGWSVMLLSGIISVAMAALIMAGWPAISVILLGILLGVNFLSSGLGYIIVSRALTPAA